MEQSSATRRAPDRSTPNMATMARDQKEKTLPTSFLPVLAIKCALAPRVAFPILCSHLLDCHEQASGVPHYDIGKGSHLLDLHVPVSRQEEVQGIVVIGLKTSASPHPDLLGNSSVCWLGHAVDDLGHHPYDLVIAFWMESSDVGDNGVAQYHLLHGSSGHRIVATISI